MLLLALADHAAQMLLIDDSGVFGVELALILGSNRGFGPVGAAADALAAETVPATPPIRVSQ